MAFYTAPSLAESDPVALAALTSAVSTLNAAMALRQLASTAATDIELADVESDLDAAVADVQAELDALELTSATDAEVASAVAAVNAVLVAHAANTANPHAVTKAQVGLGSADNTADSAKPVSSLQQAAFDADRARLTSMESGRLLSLAYDPDALLIGALTRDANEALTGAPAVWPDGATGLYAGTASTSFPGAIDAYAITHVLAGVTRTYTQPTLTRDAAGAVTTRPAIVVT